MKSRLRLGVALIAIAMLLAPVAYSVSTRPAHDAYYDAFVPEEAHHEAVEIGEYFVNCGENKEADKYVGEGGTLGDAHDGNDALVGGDEDGHFNQGLPCWEDDHRLWTDENGNVKAAAPPFYTCTADDVELEMGIQNGFPLYVPNPITGDDPFEGSQEELDAFAKNHGILLATGTFYVVPEISGPSADDVDAIWFSFLHTLPTVPGLEAGGGSEEVCVGVGDRFAHPASGVYYEFYRGDNDFRSDDNPGWIIPVNTLLVPDNVYGAKLTLLSQPDEVSETTGWDQDSEDGMHVDQPYPGGMEVIGQGYVYAMVDNLEDDTTWQPCHPTEGVDACGNQDIVPPWPVVAPGDVALEEEGPADLEVIWGEHVEEFSVRVNGDVQTPESTPVHPHHESTWDSLPLGEWTPGPWGEHLTFSNAVTCGDEVTVESTDLHGNEATKTTTIDCA